jgi:hypothetical protein
MNIAKLRELKGKDWKISRKTVPSIRGNMYIFSAERISGVKSPARTVNELFHFLNGEGHTPECWARMNAEWDEMDQWVRDHPNYCRHCQGMGGFASSYDPSPAGVSLSSGSMMEFDYCPECTEKGVCPECGQQMFDPDAFGWSDMLVCPHCGWKEETASGMPQGHQEYCPCQEKKMEESYAKMEKEGYL